MTIKVLKPSDFTNTLENQVADLYRQLNDKNRQLPLSSVLEGENNVLVLVCLLDAKLAGIALLSSYKVISGHRGLIEDVVVDGAHRKKGIGRKLMECLLEEAKKMGLDEILLFTGHHRKPAIALYSSLGFNLRESGLYMKRLA